MCQNQQLAANNFNNHLFRNSYPGRGIIVGLNVKATAIVQIYWIMGRSPGSRNRRFEFNFDGRVWTVSANPSMDTGNVDLTLYNAMLEHRDSEDLSWNIYAVSNGKQTDDICSGRQRVNFLSPNLQSWEYEPDEPNFTPRISAVCQIGEFGGAVAEMSILRRSSMSNGCDRTFHEFDLTPGFGHCLTTYMGDGSPLPAFRGDPLLMPIRGSAGLIANTYWRALDANNRVSLAVKTISLETGKSTVSIRNQY